MKRLARYYLLPGAVSISTATLLNRTIDDQLGDNSTGVLPTYFPAGGWSFGPLCVSCAVGGAVPVDHTQLFKETWHDTTYLGTGPVCSMTASFTGQAVYVFNMVANNVSIAPTTAANLSFTLDGELVGHYTHQPDLSGPTLLYQVPVYVNTNLPHGEHTLVMSAAGRSNIIFDYIVYT
ncbi:hypothetical protein C8Q77DRAFT_1024669, partial [Trametes polyzona]